MVEKDAKKARESNIELLRILAIMGVIVLHYNNAETGGGGFKYVTENSINEWVLRFLESTFICAVNLFVMITGYFMCITNHRGIKKPLQLIIQVIIFSVARYLFSVLSGNKPISVKGLMGAMVPANYFVFLYVTLYFVSPYVNNVLKNLDDKGRKMFVCTIVVLFSVWPFLVDIFEALSNRDWRGLSTVGAWGNQWGYTIVNYVMMYIIGAHFRYRDIGKAENPLLKPGYLILCLFALAMIATGLSKANENIAWEYCSPIVVAEVVAVFALFSRIRMKEKKIVNRMARAAFSVYLLHVSFVRRIGTEKFVTENVLVMLSHLALSTIAIYCICWGVSEIYDKLIGIVYRKLSKIDELSWDVFM